MTGNAYEGNIPVTAEEIRAAALKHNDDYPEAAALIVAGTPMIRVIANSDPRSGRTMRVVVHPGLETPEGWVEACDPLFVGGAMVKRDGRLSSPENARRMLAARFRGVTVAIDWTSTDEIRDRCERRELDRARHQEQEKETTVNDMTALFDTTPMRQAEALRRLAVTAGVMGQGDLFAEPVADVTRVAVEPFAWPAPVGAFYSRGDLAGQAVLA
ncbi:hypothetical protein [Actinocrispum wychmicini]|uniref:Uncharacterized protein n=1 Tax=Actinocrispum wychmicini TaxID=1213861 RepID=A0A4R2K3N2_9PSEU|nr:hypothetical protein [Actinocrispum wychmicini]TCO64379.1 hypothetical protein EV192_101147 [Actinocrispum wychmicini]